MIKLAFRPGRSMTRPADVDEGTSAHSVYIRRNIESIQVPNTRFMETGEGEETHEEFIYEEAVLSKSDYLTYKAENEAVDRDDENALATVELAEVTDEQITDNMMAITDLAAVEEQDNTDVMLSVAEAYEDLLGQIEALTARVEELEAK